MFDKNFCFTVTRITELIKGMLEGEFPSIRVEGEISNFRPSSTGHLYFSLKDQDAILGAVMFKNRVHTLNFTPADGVKVKARGGISVYAKRGNYQLICEELLKSGEGDILALLEERKKRLAAEGLFDAGRKKSLPRFPKRIAVITSPTGAALRDILQVLSRRHAGINIVILPAPVQGDEAAPALAAQLAAANEFRLADAIIIGRGGGSLEDLLPFSDERVVRAIAASTIPVISAVGHEIDFALSDFAADVRAPTPSAAAEMVASPREDLLIRITQTAQEMSRAIRQRLAGLREKTGRLSPADLERDYRGYLQPLLLRFDDAKEALLAQMQQVLLVRRHRFELAKNRLEASSPREILKRGFAVVTDRASGKILKRSRDTACGRALSISLYEGSLEAEVKSADAGPGPEKT